MVCTRIDKFYVSNYLRELGGLTGILPTIPHLSDHAPVFLHIRLTNAKLHRIPTFNRHLLHDEAARDLLVAAWKEAIWNNAGHIWNHTISKALEAVKTCADKESRNKRLIHEDVFQEQFDELNIAELDLQHQ